MTALKAVLDVEISRRSMSIRQAAEAIGVTHTTLNRALKGEQVGIETILKIADWLDVLPATLINAEGKGDDALVYQVALILRSEPRLAQVLQEAITRVANGEMSASVFKDLAAYAAYRLDTETRGDTSTKDEVQNNGVEK